MVFFTKVAKHEQAVVQVTPTKKLLWRPHRRPVFSTICNEWAWIYCSLDTYSLKLLDGEPTNLKKKKKIQPAGSTWPAPPKPAGYARWVWWVQMFWRV